MVKILGKELIFSVNSANFGIDYMLFLFVSFSELDSIGGLELDKNWESDNKLRNNQ